MFPTGFHKVSSRFRIGFQQVCSKLPAVPAGFQEFFSSRFPAGVQSVSSKCPASFQQVSSWFPIGFQQVSNKFPTSFQQAFNRFPASFQEVCSKSPAGLQQVSNRFPSSFQQVSSRFPAGFQQVSSRFPISFQQVCSRLPAVFQSALTSFSQEYEWFNYKNVLIFLAQKNPGGEETYSPQGFSYEEGKARQGFQHDSSRSTIAACGGFRNGIMRGFWAPRTLLGCFVSLGLRAGHKQP